MTEITYLKGDATTPQARGNKIIAHVCNDLGGWGKGFVLAISKRWPEPEAEYRQWHRDRAQNNFALGEIQLINVEKYIWVANMIGQRGMKIGSKGPPVRYPAIEQSLKSVADKARELSASVHMPRIGCGLAGGKWDMIEPLIEQTLCTAEIKVYVYDFGK
ncbi:macro domain-containing protein [Gimesia algae]|uniref:Macro domain protein n=1 Tax=Gimesia algae TaxID=2527971 RepID=A0A517VBH6_9PLAN|nr:macro domain-containing protein [Gimesia algae]QDT90363.1 Macro domain protein [Gimesia algae]